MSDLESLADSAQEQLAYLDEGYPPEELLWAMHGNPEGALRYLLEDAGGKDTIARRALAEVIATVDSLDESLWSREALVSAPEWADVRTKAARAMRAMEDFSGQSM